MVPTLSPQSATRLNIRAMARRTLSAARSPGVAAAPPIHACWRTAQPRVQSVGRLFDEISVTKMRDEGPADVLLECPVGLCVVV